MSGTHPMPPADPAPAPEWAVEMAQKLSVDFSQEVVNLCNRSGSLTVGSGGVWEKMLARLLATLRERTLREAAGVCGKRADEFNRLNVEGGMGKAKSYQHGQEAMACGGAILSLIAQPPKEAT